jgi:hypothetical protein
MLKTLLLSACLAASAVAVPPIGPPTRTVPLRTENACRSMFERMCRIISEMRDRGEIDDEEKLGLIRWAYAEYLACRAVPARPPYSERQGTEQ